MPLDGGNLGMGKRLFMKSKFIGYTLPILLFSIIWGAVEFLVPVRFSEASIDVTLVSVLFAISSALSVLLDIPSGRLSDRIGRGRLITYSMIISALALALLYFFSSFYAFLFASILIGISYGLNWSPLLAFVADRTNSENHGRTFGDFFVLGALGEAIAPLLIVLLVVHTDIAFPFLILALVSLCCAFIFVKLTPHTKWERKIQKDETEKFFSYRSSIALIRKSTRTNLFLLALGFFVSFFWESVWFTQPLIGFYEHTLLDSALIVAAFSLPTILFSRFFGKLIDRGGEKKVFFSSMTAVVVFFTFFYVSQAVMARVIFIFLAAIGVLGVWLVLDVLATKTNTKEERGAFFGILETVRDISYTVTPLFIGFTYTIIGLDGIFVVNSVIAVLLFLGGIGAFKILEKTRCESRV